MSIKIGINGLGRIGRMVIRSIIENKNGPIFNEPSSLIEFGIINDLQGIYVSKIEKDLQGINENSKKELEKYDKVKNFLFDGDLSPLLNDKPILWIHNNYAKNSRMWSSFYSRTTNNLNQPYLQLCLESIVRHCGESFNICIIDVAFFVNRDCILITRFTVSVDIVRGGNSILLMARSSPVFRGPMPKI